jgi:hypothetical protein
MTCYGYVDKITHGYNNGWKDPFMHIGYLDTSVHDYNTGDLETCVHACKTRYLDPSVH